MNAKESFPGVAECKIGRGIKGQTLAGQSLQRAATMSGRLVAWFGKKGTAMVALTIFAVWLAMNVFNHSKHADCEISSQMNRSHVDEAAQTPKAIVTPLYNDDGVAEEGNYNVIKLDLDMRIQIASDLHVEFYKTPDRIPPDIIIRQAPILALVGDVGVAFTETLRFFLHQQADLFEHVLFLAGNHEFYNTNGNSYTVREQMDWLQMVCDEKPNLHFLEKQAVEIGGVLILGTTLWSYVPSRLATMAEAHMNDYHLSFIEDDEGNRRKLSTAYTNKWHNESVPWVEMMIHQAESRDQQVVVLTHYTPSLKGTSDPRYDGNDMKYCFSTDLNHLLRDPVKVWACGHTHFNFRLQYFNNTRLLSNQRGYPGQEKIDFDDEGLVVTMPRSFPS